MTVITLIHSPTGWSAHVAGPEAEELVRLFGTDVLPLPFTAGASKTDVVATVRTGWPHASIQ